MRRHVILVDGYNVIHRVSRFRVQLEHSLEAGREALLRYCSEWKVRRRDVDQFYVVFDGDSSVMDGERTVSAPGVKALYSQSGETADRRIHHMLDQADRNETFTVVSDDNEVRDSARVHHMTAMSASEFSAVGESGRAAELPNSRTTKHKARVTDTKQPLSPQVARSINEELRKLWDT